MASSEEEIVNVIEKKAKEELPPEQQSVVFPDELEAGKFEQPAQAEIRTENDEYSETIIEETAESIKSESLQEVLADSLSEEPFSEEEKAEKEEMVEENIEVEKMEQREELPEPEEQEKVEEKEYSKQVELEEEFSLQEERYEVASDRTFDAFQDAQSAVLEDVEDGMFQNFQPSGEPEGEEEPVVTPESLLGAVDLTDVSLKPTEEVSATTVLKQRESMDFMEESFWEPRRRDRTIFSERCQRGDYPFRLVQTPQGVALEWVLAVKDLDYRYYLPEFIRGLKEPDSHFLAIANLCVHDMIATDKNKVKMALPYIMNDLYEALSSRFPAICINSCKVLQKLAKVVGKQLGFYFDRLFGILNTMRLKIEYVEGQKSFIKHRGMSLHPLYEEILTTWCQLQDILSRIHEKELQRMMRYWIRPLPWLTF